MNAVEKFDLVVIGAGSGGLTAARTAAQFGIRVAILEKAKIGGDCLHTGCVPSKTLITIARRFHAQKDAAAYLQGLTLKSGSASVSFGKIMEAVKASQKVIEGSSDNAEALARDGIVTINGSFAFKDRQTVVSDRGQTVCFKKCIIASGSRPTAPKIPGLASAGYLTSDTVWDLAAVPESLAIIGGGPIGLELGQAFAMLGSQVTIFERGERLVTRFDEPISQALQQGLESSGVRIIFNSSVESVEQQADIRTINYSQNDQHASVTATQLLVAIGRTPNTEQLNLEAAGVTRNDRGGIIVDKKLRTDTKHIYAVGDCLAGPLFTHWAAEQGTNAVLHALFGINRSLDAGSIPSATFTTPEIGQVGASEQQLKAEDIDYHKLQIPYGEIDKAIAEKEHGSITVLVDKKRNVLGAAIIGKNAAELTGYFSLLIAKQLPLDALGGPLQAYPTYTIALKQLAGAEQLAAFQRSWLSKLLLKIRF